MATGHRRLPSGWYRDPVGLHLARYWDGTHWTRETKDEWEGDSDVPSLIHVWMADRSEAAAEVPAEAAVDDPGAGGGVVFDLRQPSTASHSEHRSGSVLVATRDHAASEAADPGVVGALRLSAGAPSSRTDDGERRGRWLRMPLVDMPRRLRVPRLLRAAIVCGVLVFDGALYMRVH